MRTLPPGVLAALIAVAALVALAGPALTREPARSGSPGPGAFKPLVIRRDLPDATSAVDGTVAAAPADLTLREPGAAPTVVGRPAPAVQPQVRRVAVAKPSVAGARVRGGWFVSEYSWYGPGFYGSGTACGQTYTRTILGVAHRTLPCGTRVTLRNPKNGRSITVRVIDRGPYVAGRDLDLSRGTCVYLDNCYTSRIEWRLP